jgi:hypothetical protein
MDFRTLSAALSGKATMQHLDLRLSLNAVIHYLSRSLNGDLSQSGRPRFSQVRINCSNRRAIEFIRSFAGVRRLSHEFSPFRVR